VFPPSIVPESASNFQIEIVFGRLLVTTIGLDVAKSVFQVHGLMLLVRWSFDAK
jgi:hypothetical protein